jgi:hypothetical protein
MASWPQSIANFATIASFPFVSRSTFVCLVLGAVYLSANLWRTALYSVLPSGRISSLERDIGVLEREILNPNLALLGDRRREFMNAIHMCVPSHPLRYIADYAFSLCSCLVVSRIIFLTARSVTMVLPGSAGLITVRKLCVYTRTLGFMCAIFTGSRMIYRLVLRWIINSEWLTSQQRTAEKENRRVNLAIWTSARG